MCRNINQLSILQHGFRGTLVPREICSGVTRVLRVPRVPRFFRGNDFLFQDVDASL